MMEKDKLSGLLVTAVDRMVDQVKAGDTTVRTVFATAGDELYVILAPAGPDDQREITTLRNLALIFDVLDVVQYAIVSEAWVSSDASYSRGTGSQPMDDPKRSEAVIGLLVRRITGESGAPITIRRMARRVIRRTGREAIVDALEWIDATHIDGRLMRLMPAPGRPAVPRDIAERVRKAIEASTIIEKRGV